MEKGTFSDHRCYCCKPKAWWPAKCPRCGKPMTAIGWATKEGFICSYCIGKERRLKRRSRRR